MRPASLTESGANGWAQVWGRLLSRMPLLHLRNVSLAHPQGQALGAALAIGARFLQALVLHGTGLNDQACPLSASLGGPLSTFRSAGLAHRVLAAHGGRRFPRCSLRFLNRVAPPPPLPPY